MERLAQLGVIVLVVQAQFQVDEFPQVCGEGLRAPRARPKVGRGRYNIGIQAFTGRCGPVVDFVKCCFCLRCTKPGACVYLMPAQVSHGWFFCNDSRSFINDSRCCTGCSAVLLAAPDRPQRHVAYGLSGHAVAIPCVCCGHRIRPRSPDLVRCLPAKAQTKAPVVIGAVVGGAAIRWGHGVAGRPLLPWV